MRKVGQDRAAWTSSPPDPNVARELERLRDQDTNIETVGGGGGDVTFEVTGAIPEFTGVPAGLQQFYVAPIVVNDSINMTSTVLLDNDSPYNLAFVQDTSNNFATGTASIVGKVDGTDESAVTYNFANGTVSTVSTPTPAAGGHWGYRVGPTFAVVDGRSPVVTVIENGIASTVTLENPSSLVLLGVGISSDGNNICALWRTSGGATATATIRLHDRNSGAIVATSPGSTVVASTSFVATIDNGWVVWSGAGTLMYKGPADASQALSLVYTSTTPGTFGSNRNNVANNVTSDGYFFFREGNRLGRVNLVTGAVAFWPNVFVRFNNADPPVQIASITTYCLSGISATKVVYGGNYNDIGDTVPGSTPSVVDAYAVYCAVLIDGTGANVSDSIYSAYNGTTNFVYAATVTANGDVVYAVNFTGGDEYLVKVTGP